MIRMVIVWYDRDPKTFDEDHDKIHDTVVSGETPEECMDQFFALEQNHNLYKFGQLHIAGIY